jgi:zinc transport system substrate-binding protein
MVLMLSLAARPLIPALVATLALLLAGCGGGADARNGHRAVASFYPLAWVTERVAGDDWAVTNLTQPGGEPHDLELGIRQTAATDGADLVVYQHGFQPAVDDAVDNVATGEVVDAAEEVDLMPLAERGHEVHHGGHDEGEIDPHFWHDPLLMADLATAVADRLGEVDPDQAETYRANADRLRAELERLDQAYEQGLGSCERDTVVVSHDAFGYLGRYGLHFESIAGLSPDAEPTPAVLARLQQLIRTEGITTVFSERLASAAMAESLARDTGVETAVLDPIEGVAADASGSDYLSLMQDNLNALERANGC